MKAKPALIEECEEVNPLDHGSELAQASVNVLIAAVDLVNIDDMAGIFGREGSNQQGHTGPCIRAALCQSNFKTLKIRTPFFEKNFKR